MPSFTDLPPELLRTIFTRFDGQNYISTDITLFSLMRVNRLFRAVIYDILLGVPLTANSTIITPGFMVFLEKRMKALEAQCHYDLFRSSETYTPTSEPAASDGDVEWKYEPYKEMMEGRTKKQFREDTKAMMRFCGTWGEKPMLLRGDIAEALWAEIVMQRIEKDKLEEEEMAEKKWLWGSEKGLAIMYKRGV